MCGVRIGDAVADENHRPFAPARFPLREEQTGVNPLVNVRLKPPGVSPFASGPQRVDKRLRFCEHRVPVRWGQGRIKRLKVIFRERDDKEVGFCL